MATAKQLQRMQAIERELKALRAEYDDLGRQVDAGKAQLKSDINRMRKEQRGNTTTIRKELQRLRHRAATTGRQLSGRRASVKRKIKQLEKERDLLKKSL